MSKKALEPILRAVIIGSNPIGGNFFLVFSAFSTVIYIPTFLRRMRGKRNTIKKCYNFESDSVTYTCSVRYATNIQKSGYAD